MYRTIRTTLLALSLLTLNTAAQAAPETKAQKSQNKRIASASPTGAKQVKTTKQATGKQKRQIATSLPPELMQNDRATLSDDEIDLFFDNLNHSSRFDVRGAGCQLGSEQDRAFVKTWNKLRA